MGSRQRTAGEGARLPVLSRRAVLVGTGATAAVTPGRGAANPAAAPPPATDASKLYRRWLHIDTKISRLQGRWGRLESYLADEHRWFQLSDAEQKTLPAAQELRDIDGMLEQLFEQRTELLERLPVSGATRLEAVVDRLEVAARLIWAEDHPEAHAMIAGARQDLIAFLGHHRPRIG